MSDITENMDEFEYDQPIRKPQRIIRETKINPEKALENTTAILDKKQKRIPEIMKKPHILFTISF